MTQPEFVPVGHLHSFRRDGYGLHFRIRRDESYWRKGADDDTLLVE